MSNYYFYNNQLTPEENLRKLINEYNRLVAGVVNNKVGGDSADIAIKSNVDYIAMMTDVDIPTDPNSEEAPV